MKYILATLCSILYIPFALLFGICLGLIESISMIIEMFNSIAPSKEYMK